MQEAESDTALALVVVEYDIRAGVVVAVVEHRPVGAAERKSVHDHVDRGKDRTGGCWYGVVWPLVLGGPYVGIPGLGYDCSPCGGVGVFG